jgi:Fe-S cluster assembly protein SufD
MSEFQRQALRLAAQQKSLPWLQTLRAQAANDWLAQAWPTRKTEHWKYTPLQFLQKQQLQAWGKAAAVDLAGMDLIPLDAIRLVFVNGVFDAKNSSPLTETVVRFIDADANQQALIQQYLGKVVEGERHLFATLNNAWLDDGILIHVPRNKTLEKPVYVVNFTTATLAAASTNQRILLVLEENSKAELIEHYLSTDEIQNGFVNALTEIVIGDNARLQHYRLNLEEENAQHIGAVHVDLQRNSRLRGFTLSLGSRLKRIDYQLNHRGPGAELDLQGVYLPRNQQMVDYHTNVCHWVPHCTSNEVFRGIIADSAQAIFNGRIYIHENAQKLWRN